MNASDRLNARIAAMTTEQLLEASLRLTLATEVEAIIVCNRIETELAKRLDDKTFVEHMAACEALLDAAA